MLPRLCPKPNLQFAKLGIFFMSYQDIMAY